MQAQENLFFSTDVMAALHDTPVSAVGAGDARGKATSPANFFG